MKTESNANGATDVIWTSSVVLPQLTQEECFPMINNYPVSSIFTNLVTPDSDKVSLQNTSDVPQTMDLIVLQSDDYKLENQTNTSKEVPNDFILLKENVDENGTTSPVKIDETKPILKKVKKIKGDKDFEQMLYFVCNLCPYLCINDSKITEHLEIEHKTKTSTKILQLKCPACPNYFYNKVPLRSHLIHDHKVDNSDLLKIIQAVVYFSKKSLNSTKSTDLLTSKIEIETSTHDCKSELDMRYSEKIINIGKNTDVEISDTNISENGLEKLNLPYRDREVELLPDVNTSIVDITHNDATKTFATIIKKKPDMLSKYLDQKNFHKCTVPTCKIRLQDPIKITYHIKCHLKGSFKCPECSESFAFWKPLASHLWRLHKIDMELFSCDKCDYKTYSIGKLNNIHKLIHSDLKAFMCDVCSKRFKNTKQLRNHKATHKEKSDKPIHTCEDCAKNFVDRRQLKVHIDGVHKKLKPFLCSYCGYKGASKNALQMHIRQHTGEKPFVCDTCNYATADHNSLRRHKLRHTGQKPYKCAHCDYACIQSSTYKIHLRTKHPGLEKGLLYTCQECQFRTIKQEIYMSHLFLVHKQKPAE